MTHPPTTRGLQLVLIPSGPAFSEWFQDGGVLSTFVLATCLPLDIVIVVFKVCVL